MELIQQKLNTGQISHSNMDYQAYTEDFRISLSEKLGLLIIKGNMACQSCRKKLNTVLTRIKKGLMDSGHLSVYINLENVNVTGLGKLLRIVCTLDLLARQGKEIDVYWNTRNDRELTAIAENFGELLPGQLMITDF